MLLLFFLPLFAHLPRKQQLKAHVLHIDIVFHSAVSAFNSKRSHKCAHVRLILIGYLSLCLVDLGREFQLQVDFYGANQKLISFR
jgi:hypothetical protein